MLTAITLSALGSPLKTRGGANCIWAIDTRTQCARSTYSVAIAAAATCERLWPSSSAAFAFIFLGHAAQRVGRKIVRHCTGQSAAATSLDPEIVGAHFVCDVFQQVHRPGEVTILVENRSRIGTEVYTRSEAFPPVTPRICRCVLIAIAMDTRHAAGTRPYWCGDAK